MKREAGGPCLSAVFVDYDNIYLSLKRKSDEAAKGFAREAARWLKEIEGGALITATNAAFGTVPRRVVMNRCYGNPVPRRNPHDNSTDMSSFPFVRHHFLRAGFEVIDCPPLTAQLKSSADIRMVMDIRDLLLHDTYYDEFIIMSGDADFTPVLIRLRAHARRTVVFANDFTAAPYTAICDGEVREAALIDLILAGEPPEGVGEETTAAAPPQDAGKGRIEETRREILAEVIAGVRASATPVPLEALAERTLRALGPERTIATGWAGAGSFRELLRRNLPDEIQLTGDPPELAVDMNRHRDDRPQRAEAAVAPQSAAPGDAEPREAPASVEEPVQRARADMDPAPVGEREPGPDAHPAASQGAMPDQPEAVPPQDAPQAPRRLDAPSPIQQSIARIQEACQAPPLAPQEYRAVFEIMAQEINDHDLLGVQTLNNITRRARERGIELGHDDARFVLEVVSEADPWFEEGASADLFAARFRTFVVARCRGQGLNLTANELDLIDAWFLGTGMGQRGVLKAAVDRSAPALAAPRTVGADPRAGAAAEERWWSLDDGRVHRQAGPQDAGVSAPNELPRVVRTRSRG